MNKEEFKTEFRIWRAVISSIDRTKIAKGLSKEDQSKVWDIFWKQIYMQMPSHIYKIIIDSPYHPCSSWGITSSAKMKCNMEYLSNSYPRTDVRNR